MAKIQQLKFDRSRNSRLCDVQKNTRAFYSFKKDLEFNLIETRCIFEYVYPIHHYRSIACFCSSRPRGGRENSNEET